MKTDLLISPIQNIRFIWELGGVREKKESKENKEEITKIGCEDKG